MPETVQRISTGYAPRPHQDAVHRNMKRFNVLVAHRRFGKTILAVNELIDQCLRCQRPAPRYAYIAPLFNQAKEIAWDYLKQYTRMIPGMQANESELRVDLPGDRRIRLYGADNPDRLRGPYLDGVVFDEHAQMPPKVWPEVIRPALADRQGTALFIGTPMGRNEFLDLYEAAKADPAWYAATFKASETGIIPAGELEAARKVMTPDQYAQEFECSFTAAVIGAYYGAAMNEAEIEGRIRAVAFDAAVPVTTAWDLGIGDSTAIWFVQRVGAEIHIIDYLENHGQGLAWYANEILDRKRRGWVYAEHLLPHDAEAKELGTGKTRTETLRTLGIHARIIPAQSVDDGINAVRLLLPNCWFDSVKCAKGIEALRQYRRDYDDRAKTFRDRPRHDWASHGADAFRYLAMGLKPEPRKQPKQAPHHGAQAWMG